MFVVHNSTVVDHCCVPVIYEYLGCEWKCPYSARKVYTTVPRYIQCAYLGTEYIPWNVWNRSLQSIFQGCFQSSECCGSQVDSSLTDSYFQLTGVIQIRRTSARRSHPYFGHIYFFKTVRSVLVRYPNHFRSFLKNVYKEVTELVQWYWITL